MTARVRVAVAPPYDVVIGPGLLDELAAVLPPLPHARRAALVTTGGVRALYADRVTAGLRARGLGVESVIVPDGEEAKTLATVTTVYH
nr:3-dehydroquinate synthase [Actinomycetota bacterium]